MLFTSFNMFNGGIVFHYTFKEVCIVFTILRYGFLTMETYRVIYGITVLNPWLASTMKILVLCLTTPKSYSEIITLYESDMDRKRLVCITIYLTMVTFSL